MSLTQNGEFAQTLRKKQDKFTAAAWNDALDTEFPNFEILRIAALVPPDAMEAYVEAGGARYP